MPLCCNVPVSLVDSQYQLAAARHRSTLWRQPAWLLLMLTALLAGCVPDAAPTQLATSPDQLPSDEELLRELDEVLQFTYDERHLNLREHAAWQILHGALAYQRGFLVDNDDGSRISAVEHLMQGGSMKGWQVEVVSNDTGQLGLRALVEEGSKTGQGHVDQWLAILAQCDLPPDQIIRVGDQQVTMADFVAQAQWDVPRNVLREYSWTLIGLSTYLPQGATWTASDGRQWDLEKLIAIEAEQELATAACGGTHRLIGMSMALNRHLAADGKLEGGWQQADRVLQDAIKQARQLQNADGSFSTNYFQRPGRSPDLAQNLGASGHILEFLTLSLTDEQLREPWMQRAVLHMCQLFRQTRKVPLECGALYHAAHGLVLYRTRLYGPKDYSL